MKKFVKNAVAYLGPVFNSNRMVQQYLQSFYLKAAENFRRLTAADFALARKQAQWQERVRGHWAKVAVRL